jgi:hypothetical protein
MPDAGFWPPTDDIGMSYAVLWSEAGGPTFAGKLELRDRLLFLEGANCGVHRRTLDLDQVASLRIGRGRLERLQGRPVLVLEDGNGSRLCLATLDGIGALHELADALGSQLDVVSRNA